MVSIHIDLPIFSSPTKPHGWFSGDVDLVRRPEKDDPFPWPIHWLGEFRDLLASALHATMYGIVCADYTQAQQVAAHIERCSGIRYDEHLAA